MSTGERRRRRRRRSRMKKKKPIHHQEKKNDQKEKDADVVCKTGRKASKASHAFVKSFLVRIRRLSLCRVVRLSSSSLVACHSHCRDFT
jgi:hypothetical protein